MRIFTAPEYAVPLFLVACALPILAILSVAHWKMALLLTTLVVLSSLRHRGRTQRRRRDEANYRRQTYGF